ncbi:MAG: hypothetical protein FWE14_09350 [Lachnospiraceae bacterium]|nr:hypothetical protein [Lachnospiraceae bacterium]
MYSTRTGRRPGENHITTLSDSVKRYIPGIKEYGEHREGYQVLGKGPLCGPEALIK